MKGKLQMMDGCRPNPLMQKKFHKDVKLLAFPLKLGYFYLCL